MSAGADTGHLLYPGLLRYIPVDGLLSAPAQEDPGFRRRARNIRATRPRSPRCRGLRSPKLLGVLV